MRRALSALLLLALAGTGEPAAAAGPSSLPARVERDLAWKGKADLPEGLVVAGGATLTLEEGARLRFGEGKGLLVEGVLVVRGTPGGGKGTGRERGREKEKPAPGVALSPLGKSPWAGVRFAPGARGTLDGVAVSGAAVGVDAPGAEVEIVRSTLERCEKGCSFSAGSRFSLKESLLAGNQAGVHAESGAKGEILSCFFRENTFGVGTVSGAFLRVARNRFEKGGMGIQVNQAFSGVIERNLFSDLSAGVRFNLAGEGATVQGNVFSGCSEGAVQVTSLSSPRILNNVVEKGKFGVEALHFSSPEIRNNRFTGLAHAVSLERMNRSVVAANLFTGNQTGVMCNFSSYPLLRDNAFEGNRVHVEVGTMQSGAWEAAVGSERNRNKNAAEAGNRNPDAIGAPVALPRQVDATGNWWDEGTRKEMEEKGAEGNILALRDGRDPDVTFEGALYPRDSIAFSPWLSARPAAGLVGWTGAREELFTDGRGVVEGRVVDEKGRPAAGALVSAWPRAGLAGDPAVVSAPSGADGLYSLRLDPGRHSLAASAGGRFSASGQNPVTVAAGERVRLGFVLLDWDPPVRTKSPEAGADGVVRGRVTLLGKGVEGVTVSLYLDDADSFRGPAFLSAPSGKDGSFSLEMVPPSRYFLVARKRGSGQEVGPMLRGDLFGFLRGNPVPVGEGEVVTLTLPLLDKRSDRDINALGLPGTQPGFGGAVRGPDGKALAGLHAFAYPEPEMGHHKPAAVSSLTDPSGRYKLYLPAAGRYFVGARQGFGDSPAPGEWFGFWQGNPEHALEVGEGGFQDGVDIVVDRVLQ